MPDRRRLGCLVLVLVVTLAAWLGWRTFQAYVRENPEQFPWTPLSLTDPIGPFTAAKLAALADDPRRCRALLSVAGSGDRPASAVKPDEAQCGYEDGMRLAPATRYAPSGLVAACPVAAALHLWEQQIDRAAVRLLGEPVARIEHFGSYSCRRRYGRSDAGWSEHATADAIDIAGFRLADGRRISVLRDWSGEGPEAAFLRASRDSACRLFATTLSPDYNAAHRDHLHLDMAQRGSAGWTVCR